MDLACIRTLQPASLSSGASLTPRLWLGGALSWDHPSGPVLSRSTTHPHSGHISARTWSFQAMGRKKCLPNSMRRPQLFCTYRERVPHLVAQGLGPPLRIKEQIWVVEPLVQGPESALHPSRLQGGPTRL